MKTSAGDEVYDRGRLSVTLSMLPTADAEERSRQSGRARALSLTRVGAGKHELLPYKKLAPAFRVIFVVTLQRRQLLQLHHEWPRQGRKRSGKRRRQASQKGSS